MVHLDHDEEHGEEDGCRIDDAHGQIVGVAPEEMAGEPEGCGGDAVAIEQPVEDRPRADRVADDLRIPDDAPEHGERHPRGEPAECAERSLLSHPGNARHHQGKRNGEPAFLEREAQRKRERGDGAGGEDSARRAAAALRARACVRISVASAKAPARRTAAPAKGIERSKPAMR